MFLKTSHNLLSPDTASNGASIAPAFARAIAVGGGPGGETQSSGKVIEASVQEPSSPSSLSLDSGPSAIGRLCFRLGVQKKERDATSAELCAIGAASFRET